MKQPLQTNAWHTRLDWPGGIRTAVVVGSALTLINQWDALLASTAFSYSKAGLTYLVPFCVYQYGRLSKKAKNENASA